MAGGQDKDPIADISLGVVTYDVAEGDGYFRDDNDTGGPIADCMMHNHFARDGHTYVGSLTTPEPFNGATVGAVRLGNDTLTWVCEWTVCQLVSPGQHPPVPDPSPPPGWVMMDLRLSPAMTSLGPSGIDLVYRISGIYVYGHLKPLQDYFADVAYPYAPWLKQGFPRMVPLSALKDYLKYPTPGAKSSNQDLANFGAGGGFGQGLTPPNNLALIPGMRG